MLLPSLKQQKLDLLLFHSLENILSPGKEIVKFLKNDKRGTSSPKGFLALSTGRPISI